MKLLGVWLSILAGTAFAQQDSATALARILAGKGTISSAELSQVEAAAPGERVSLLASLLERKGVLTASDVASLGVAPVSSGVQTAQTPHQESLQSAPRPDPGPPVTTQTKVPVAIYGTLLVNAFSNTAATNVTDIPLFASKQGSDALGNDKNFGMTARQTRLGARIQAGSVAGGRLTGQVEFDFLGGKAPFTNGINMDLLRLRLAYGRIDWDSFSFEAGQDWSIFAPLNPTSLASFAIPSMSASGNPWIRMPQIRGEFHTKLGEAKLLTQLAAIDPNMGDYSTAAFSATRPPGTGERGRAPGAEARFALTGTHDDRDFIIGVSGHYAHGKNSGTIGPATVQLPIDSWGAAVDYVLPIAKIFNLSGELYTGRALGIFSETSGEAISAVGQPGQLGVRTSGGWTQAQFNFTPKWQFNLAYGIDDPRSRDLPIGNRTRNQTYMGNVIYKYNSHLNVAWEYRRLLTDFRNQSAANERGDHANLAFAYFF